jgi:hypothetical protein
MRQLRAASEERRVEIHAVIHIANRDWVGLISARPLEAGAVAAVTVFGARQATTANVS